MNLPRSKIRVALVTFVWFAAIAWLRPLTLPDEGRYVGVAWEMVRSGDWLTPMLNGMPFFHKPPLFYWINASALSIFGIHEIAGRVASLLGATISCLGVFWIMRRRSTIDSAYFALIALAVQPLFFIGAQFANLDMLVAGMITATIVLAAEAAMLAQENKPYKTVLVLAYCFAALGLLAKGLIGFVLPGGVIVLWLIIIGQPRLIQHLISAPGLVLFLLIAAPWFVAMQMRYPAFFDYFFITQHFRRFAEAGFNNVQPFWFYPALLAIFAIPLLPWFVSGALKARKGLLTPQPVRIGLLRISPLGSLLVVWAALITLFFSMPQSKLVGYIFPAVPALAGLVGLLFARLQLWQKHRTAWLVTMAAYALLGIGVVVFFTFRPSDSTREIARTLQTQRTANQPIFMIGKYFYDLPVYARLVKPLAIVSDWDYEKIKLNDNWRKEVADAGQFDPKLASNLLISAQQLRERLCLHPISWVVSHTDDGIDFSNLPGVTVAYEGQPRRGHAAINLWKVDLANPPLFKALGCEKMPSADSTNK